MASKQVHHAGFVISDMERSVEFYSTNFGFEERVRLEMSGGDLERAVDVVGARILLVMLATETVLLELIQYLDSPGRSQAAGNNDVGAAHICITVDDIDVDHQRLTDNGVEFIAPPSQPVPGVGSRFAYLRDPDRITIELLQAVPGMTLAELRLRSLDP